MNTPLFPTRWPPQNPKQLQLYSLATPNGQKIGVALEELELPYEAHQINIFEDDQFDEGFKAINPNSKIPCIIDPNGPKGEPIQLMESGAILLYLAEKTGKLMSSDPHLRLETIEWVFFQMANVGPMFGQFGHFFKYAKDKTTDEYPVERYTKETKRLLAVLDKRLEGRDYIIDGGYSIADISIFPWINGLDFYDGKEHLGYSAHKNIHAWIERCMARPAVQRGVKVCSSM